MKKKVICLYRVSTKKQATEVEVGDAGDRYDIPMQKQACREFILKNSEWELYRELSEFGVSGYKVSAEKRDAIQEIQREALSGSFNVLLVFMFDRLGRIDDETPFIVEWFVRHGIEVWSVKEGEQRFENHIDKLTNYIRFWQASGESEKTSIRTKEGLAQMVKEGRFRGGVAPYGYRLEKQGRINKRGHEVFDIYVDEEEAEVVRLIFDLYISRGYGSHRIASYLLSAGMKNRKGENFTNGTVNNMLTNRTYTGILKSGETESDVFASLQIIKPEIFVIAQQLREQRTLVNDDSRRVPLTTCGKTLLSGNVFCGHCGGRLIIATNKRKYIRKDGGCMIKDRARYTCQNKISHRTECDGQTGYTATKLDGMVNTIVLNLFSSLDDMSKEEIVYERYEQLISEKCIALDKARADWHECLAEAREYEEEVLRIIRGESKLGSELLNKLHWNAEMRAAKAEQSVRDLEESLQSNQQIKETLLESYENLRSWSSVYDSCDIEERKMIVSRIISEVRVKRDYILEVKPTFSIELLGMVLRDGDQF